MQYVFYDKCLFVKEYTDDEILVCLRNRQNHAVHFLYSSCFPLIRHLVMKNGGSVDDSEEIFQDGLEILLKNVYVNNFTLTCKLKTYLFSICDNLWKWELSKKRAEENYFKRKVEDDMVVDFTETQDYELREKIFYGAFETLDSLHQKILKLSWQDYSLKEIADELGYSAGYVKKEKCIGQAELVKRVKGNRDYNLIMDSE